MTFAERMISNEELKALTQAIKKRYGIDFTGYETRSLKRGFGRIIMKNGMESVLSLWSKIMADRAFFKYCIDELTVNLTELFRNPDIWLKLKADVLPKYETKRDLRIWHAGCSSGEEVYTMGIVLNEMFMLHRAKTLATDLSVSIIEQAKEGEYSNLLMQKYIRSFGKYLGNGSLEDNFKLKEDSATIKDELKRNVTFLVHNLVQDKMYQKFDIIFCRNVMIYFDNSLKMKVLQLFHDALEDDGFFVIGYYDMLPLESARLFKPYDSKTRIYQKITT
mgnify:CR=1 FL=1